MFIGDAPLIMNEILEKARDILVHELLCDSCLGRCFAKLGTGLTNEERGRALRVVCAMADEIKMSSPTRCSICQNIFDQIEDWAIRCSQKIQGVEFERYLMGTRPPADIVQNEEALWKKLSIQKEQAEPFKQEFNRRVGKRFGQLLHDLGRHVDVDFTHPEVVFLIDLENEDLEVQIHSLFIYGRYKKFVRDIPQTEWPCRHCKGRGCALCNQSGKQYQTSVGELIAAEALRAAKSQGHAFHGAGREDIDARMLGTGRPFVLEIKSPKVRKLDLIDLREEINQFARDRVEVGPLKFVKRELVEEIKEGRAKKTYHARVNFGSPVDQSVLKSALERLMGRISQETPKRVLHRRADLTRTREVFLITGESLSPCEALIKLHCDGGLYVKELISGDGGRTEPSLAGLLGCEARVTELDVVEVLGKFPDLF